MQILDNLEAVLPSLGPRDQSFARDLILKGRVRGLSEKQMYWVVTLTNKAVAPSPEPTEMLEVAGIISLIKTASEKLKYPKIRLTTESGQKVVLGLAGERSKYNGSVMITDGGPFGSNLFFGRINPDGGFVPSGKITEEITNLLKMFAADPAGVGAMIGRRTGHCCFCYRGLDTKESLAVGYGPVCAEKYQLPWG